MKLRFYVFGLAWLFTIHGAAQNFPTAAVSPLAGTPFIQVSADFNRDGHLDIAYLDASSGGNLHLLLGKGDGTFTTGQVVSLASGVGGDITVGDINADGIPDLVVGYGGGTSPLAITALMGKGDGTFAAPIASPVISYVSPAAISYRVGIGDFDGDGVPDLVYSDGYEFLYFMKGDGHGNFGTPTRFPAFDSTKYIGYGMGDIYVYDLNGDGHPDLVGPGGNGINVLLGQGAGTFAPAVTYTTTGGLNLADFDGDGHIDGITCDTTTGKISVSYGRSDGTFAANVSVGSVPNHEGFVTGITDLHGDHKNRVVVASPDGVSITLGATPGGTETYAGTFAQNIVAFSATNQYLLGDFNEDGYTDIVMPADNALAILYGESDGTFNGGVSIETDGYIGVGGLQMVDVTGDHIPDAVITTSAIFRGNGDGTFSRLPNYNTFPVQSQLYPADFNGDGNIDFLTGETIYYGQGDGTFNSSLALSGLANGSVVFPTGSYATGDFNHDGKPDVAASMSSNSTIVNGLAFATSTSAAKTYTYSYFNMTEVPGPLGAGDFDGDHCDDLAAAGQTEIMILKSDCLGNFTQIASYATGYSGSPYFAPFQTSREATDMVVTDLDGDGHLDIVYTISSASIARVLYGKGDDTFTPGPDLVLAHASNFVTAGDLDGDGRPDLVFSGHGLITILHGQANRTFSAPQYLAGGYQTGKVALADLRLRGHLDIAVPNLGHEGNLTNEQGYSFAVFLNPLSAGLSTNTTLTCSPTSIPVFNTALLTATVTSSNGTPTGSIAFTDNGAALATQTLLSGTTSLTYTGQSVGTHTLTATYVPTGAFAASSASCSEVVNGLPTTSVLRVTPTTTTYGSPVTLTATVSPITLPGPSTPTGPVTFYNGSTVIGTGTLANGVATLALSTLPGGSYNLTCTYGGSSIYATSNCNSVPVVINAAATKLTLRSSNNPAPALSPITFTAHLTANGQSAGAGNAITLSLNGQTINLATDATGSAAYTVSTLTPNSYPVTATFAATNSLLASSTSLTEVVTAVPTITNLTVAPNPAHFSQLVTMVATVSLPATSTPVTSGSVTFFDGTTSLATQPVTASGTASFTISTLTIGTHPITATFTTTNPDYITSTSSVDNELILPSGFTIALSPATITLSPGAAGTAAIQLASVGNFAGPLALTYGTPPTYATASINPTTVTLTAGGTGSSALTLNTLLKATNSIPTKPGSRELPVVFTALVSLFVPFSFSRRNKLTRFLGLALLIVSLQAITGCTNTWYTANAVAPGTYQLPVTATDLNHISQTATLTVIVTP